MMEEVDMATEEMFKDIEKKERQRIVKLIEFIDVELMLTDVRDKQGNIVEFSSDVMGLIKVWWDMKSEKLLKEISQKEKGDEK